MVGGRQLKILEIEGLKKHFGEVRAVDGISFSVEQGSLFAFLGLNGAGKSTTINIVCTLLPKDEGRVSAAGFDLDREPEKIRREIGVVFQGSMLDNALSIRDNLSVRAGLYGLSGRAWSERLKELSEELALSDILDRRYGTLSGGQRRRADIARALLHQPSLLILDEPTTGLDPQTRKTVWSVLEGLRKQRGMTVFLTTHYMEEANRADNVVILDAGRIAAQDSPVRLKERFCSDYVRVYAPRSPQLDAAFSPCSPVYEQNCYLLPVADSRAAKEVLRRFDREIADFEVVKGDMDDVFLKVTGKQLKEDAE